LWALGRLHAIVRARNCSWWRWPFFEISPRICKQLQFFATFESSCGLVTLPCVGVEIFSKSLVGDDWSNPWVKLVPTVYTMPYIFPGMSLLEDDWSNTNRYAIEIHNGIHKIQMLSTQHQYLDSSITTAPRYPSAQVQIQRPCLQH
jgi:hypothetical protein